MRGKLMKFVAGAIAYAMVCTNLVQVPVMAEGIVYNGMKDISRHSDSASKDNNEEVSAEDVFAEDDTESITADSESLISKEKKANDEAEAEDIEPSIGKSIDIGALKKPMTGLATYEAPKPVEDIDEEESTRLQELLSNYVKPETLLKNNAKSYYYYNVIDPFAKEIYDILYDLACDPVNLENIGMMITDKDPDGDEFIQEYMIALRALEIDHPELFWMYAGEAEIGWFAEESNGLYYCFWRFIEPYDEFEEVMNNFNDAAEEFLLDIDTEVPDNEIVRQVHDKLAELVTYDTPVCERHCQDLAHTAYGCFVEDSEGIPNCAVCDGYSFAMEYILQQCGIDATLVLGVGGHDEESAGGHAWNIVKIGEEWYEVDSTWDDHNDDLDDISEDDAAYVFLKNAYEDEEYRELMDHAYFLRSTDEFRTLVTSDDPAYSYYYDDFSWNFVDDSVHIRDNEWYDIIEEDMFNPDVVLMDLAPVAVDTFDPDTYVDTDESSIEETDDMQEPEEENYDIDNYEIGELGLPIYEVSEFAAKVLKEQVIVDVPEDWGNNASESTRISYSPVNDSGAISPSAGTLSLNYFADEEEDSEQLYDIYEDNIAKMNMVSDVTSSDIEAAGIEGRRIDYLILLGANNFLCTDVLFDYDGTTYVLEIMQGNQSFFDYYPMFNEVVGSSRIGSGEEIEEAISVSDSESEDFEEEEDVDEPEDDEKSDENHGLRKVGDEEDSKEDVEKSVDEDDEITEETEDVEAEEDSEVKRLGKDETESEDDESDIGSLADFVFMINGHEYDFPTEVGDIMDDLNLDLDVMIPYDFKSDEDLVSGEWTEIINTQYFYFDNTLFLEMAGITNMTGEEAAAEDCMLTALVDTLGDDVAIELPGGVKVGESEENIFKGFPKFDELKMDGVASFIGNELLYACNVRDDGCNGYVLIRNDEPYYSCVSIICEDDLIKEISYECLGAVRADGVFLDE